MLGVQDTLYLGNLDARRDWGHARDFVEAQWLIMQAPAPGDYVVATGVQYSVRDFVNRAAEHLRLKLHWEGSGRDERALDDDGRCRVAVDPRYLRPAEVDTLLGDSSKARRELGWEPKIDFDSLVTEMVDADLARERGQLRAEQSGGP